jgi:uncharacterized membrane protein
VIMTLVSRPEQRESLLHHAQMILRACEQSVSEETDRSDVQAAYDTLIAMTNEIWDG